MNIKKTISKFKIIWITPLIAGGIIGLVISKPKQSQSSQMVSPVANEEKSAKSITSDGGRTDSSEVIQNGNSNQPLDTYLLSAQSLLTKAIALSHQGTTCEVEKSVEVTPRTVAERTPPRCDEQLTVRERNKRIVELINQAIDTNNQAIANFPSSAAAYAQQAKTYQTISKYMPEAEPAAVAYWQQAIKIDSNNPVYYDSLADLYLTRINDNGQGTTSEVAQSDSSDGVGIGHLNLALFYLDKAVETDPTNPNRIKKLAEIQSQAGYINKAKITYQRLLGIISDENQIAKIKTEINSLNKLLAEAASSEVTPPRCPNGLLGRCNEAKSNEPRNPNPETILLPDSPPKLQAHHLAGINTFIAEPKDSSDDGRMDSSEVSKSNAKSGTAVIPAGQRQVEICNNNLGPKTQVYLTPEDNAKNIILFVKSKSAYDPASKHCPNFIAGIASPLDSDLKFKWWLINDQEND